MKTKR
jgi:hypothetical protein